ncbi:MAG TPA: carboxypeptidase regulatory-like domain-containing protein [Candidatus Cybelea sp.]|nr:carboxypeptidase regulatory-like domain-containing protein [Candidatus Cybelea sp.]
MRLFRRAFIPVSLLIFVPALYAQSTISGYVTGAVTDSSKSSVNAATVTLKNLETSFSQTTATDSSGVYRFEYVPPGEYKLSITATGFSTSEQSVTVTVGQSTTANVQLMIGSSSSIVVVHSDAGPIQTENGDITTNYNETQIQSVPNPGADLTYIAQTAPGTIMNTQNGGGNFSVFGLPGYSNMFTINGMDYLNSYGDNNKSGATNNSLGANEMQSVTVVENGYSGNYGRLVAANVNFVSKSGSNQFHGNAIYDWNGSSLNANDYFNNLHDTRRPFDNVNQWAASLGGPIWKDHTFFFIDNEGLRIVLPTTSSVNIPSPQFEAATIANLQNVSPASVSFYNTIFNLYNQAPGASHAVNVLPGGGCGSFQVLGLGVPCALQFQAIPGNFTGEWLLAWRIDQIISSRDQVFLHVFTDHGIQATNTNVINSGFNQSSPQPEWQGQLNETHTFSNRAVNQLVTAFQWSGILFGPLDPAATLNVFPALLNFSNGSFTPLGQNQAHPVGRHITQYQIVDDYSYTLGKHTLRAGVDFLRDDLNVFFYGSNTAGTITSDLANFYNGNATNFVQSFPNTLHSPFAAYDLGFYVEDDWALAPHFKLTGALRLDRESNITSLQNRFARLTAPFESTDHDPSVPYNRAIQTNVSQAFYSTTPLAIEPRLGFAWSPLGSSTTVVRGGVGNFRDFLPQQELQGFALNTPNVNAFTVTGGPLSPAAANNIFSTAAAYNSAFANGFSQGATLASLQAAVPTFTPPAYYGAQHDTINPTYVEWNLEIQRSLDSNTSVSANYVGNHGIHQVFINQGLNAFDASGFAGLPVTAPDPRFSNVTELQTDGTSNYNGVTLSARHNFSHSFQATASYTYSHALDDVSDNGFTAWSYNTDPSIQYPQNPDDPHANYGNNDADVRHALSASYVWTPALDSVVGHGPRRLWSGWSVSGTFFYRTGLPFTVIDSADTATLAGSANAANYGSATLFANYLGGAQPTCSSPTTLCLVAADFSPATDGFGQQRRNQFRGPGFFNTDLSILKNTGLHLWGEGQRLSFGANFYNVLNHPNFDQPVADIGNAQFGQIVQTVSPPTSILGSGLGGDSSPRQIQLTAKFAF